MFEGKKVPVCTREVVVEADPGQDMVEGHIDSLQPDGTALQVSRLQQLCKSITGKTKDTWVCVVGTGHQLKHSTTLVFRQNRQAKHRPVARSSD